MKTVLNQQSPVNTVSEAKGFSRKHYMKMVFWSPFQLEMGSEWQPWATENLRPVADLEPHSYCHREHWAQRWWKNSPLQPDNR